jgi:choline monooxygenase
MGVPVLLVRQKSGELGAFHNVCSHRGLQLVNTPRKINGLIVCPYHSWSYSLTGELKATPHIGGVGEHRTDGFHCAKHGLKPIRFHVWLGILFINLDGNAPAFGEAAATVVERYRELMGTAGESEMRCATTHAGASIDVNCNWKLALENYLEAYHLPFVHPGLNSYSPLEQHYNEIISESCAGQVTQTFDPGLDRDDPLPLFSQWDADRLVTGEYPVLYPNLLLGFQANHVFAMIVHPLSADTCREELMVFYAGDEANEDRFLRQREANLDAWTAVFNEDIEPCERMQVGRNSPGYQGGAFSPAHDVCSHHFHRWVAEQYLAASG